jgi:hypothetical protein
MKQIIIVFLRFIILIPVGIGLSALLAWPVQFLWNHVMTQIFWGLRDISFLQAWGLSLLCGLLFKSSVRSEK